jgi:hemerythrin-like domain-containing protein
MQSAIAIIKDEHLSMASVIKGMLANVAAIRSGTMDPDPYLFAAMFDYIEAFPERLHHPKEDEYLFRFLRLRCEAAHAMLDELQEEHARGAELLETLRRALAAFEENDDLDAFEAALKEYADFYRNHMAKEEKTVLPLAAEHLTPEDWNAIDTAFRLHRRSRWRQRGRLRWTGGRSI